MIHKIVAITDFQITGPYALKITFSDGKISSIDLTGMLRGELYGPLQNQEFFRSVKLDPEAKTLVWPNGADFDPATLYDWDSSEDELRRRSQSW